MPVLWRFVSAFGQPLTYFPQLFTVKVDLGTTLPDLEPKFFQDVITLKFIGRDKVMSQIITFLKLMVK